eukprot:COSAG01_NODE_17031_length_1183_cov_2.935424_1_plen_209_part_10
MDAVPFVGAACEISCSRGGADTCCGVEAAEERRVRRGGEPIQVGRLGAHASAIFAVVAAVAETLIVCDNNTIFRAPSILAASQTATNCNYRDCVCVFCTGQDRDEMRRSGKAAAAAAPAAANPQWRLSRRRRRHGRREVHHQHQHEHQQHHLAMRSAARGWPRAAQMWPGWYVLCGCCGPAGSVMAAARARAAAAARRRCLIDLLCAMA